MNAAIRNEVEHVIERFCAAIVPLARAQVIGMLQAAFAAAGHSSARSLAPASDKAKQRRPATTSRVESTSRAAKPARKQNPDNIAARILASIELQHAPGERIERAEIVAAAGAASVAELSQALKMLVAGGQLVRRGHARGTWYARPEAPAASQVPVIAEADAEPTGVTPPTAVTETASAESPKKSRKPRAKKGPSKAEIGRWVDERLQKRVAEDAAVGASP